MNQEQEITQAVKQFRKTVDRINTSDHPQYRDPLVKEYEIKAARAELDAKVSELSNDFDKSIGAQIEDAEQKANASRFYVSETQKQQADYALDAYVADIKLAYDDNAKHEAYNTLERRLNGMSEAELAHIRLQLPKVLARVGDDPVALKKLRSVNDTLAKLKTPEQERLDELKEAKRVGAAQAHKRLKMTHPAYSHLPTNQNSGHFKGSL